MGTRDGDAKSTETLEMIELRASRIASVLLVAVCLYVVFEASIELWWHASADFLFIGFAVTVVAIPVMLLLAPAKRRLAAKLDSGSLNADAAQGVAYWYLAVLVIVGMSAQRWFGLWWVTPSAR